MRELEFHVIVRTKVTHTIVGPLAIRTVYNAGRLDLAIEYVQHQVARLLGRGRFGSLADVRLMKEEGWEVVAADAEQIAQAARVEAERADVDAKWREVDRQLRRLTGRN